MTRGNDCVTHPSSDLASLGHLLPQGEKEERRIAANTSLKRWRLAAAAALLFLLPLREKVAERSEVG